MLRRFLVAGLTACAIALVLARPQAASRTGGEGYEFWPECSDVPDSFVFLPYYLGRDTPGFVDLGQNEELVPGFPVRQLQLTRDKTFGPVPGTIGRWYGVRMGFARWPLGTDAARRQLAAGAAVGLTCATVSEAEAVALFCRDILLANEIVTADKCARMAALARASSVAVAVDSVQGLETLAAIRRARAYVREAIRRAPGFGQGHGPLDHAHTVAAFTG